jgi:hypothetical protein
VCLEAEGQEYKISAAVKWGARKPLSNPSTLNKNDSAKVCCNAYRVKILFLSQHGYSRFQN